MAPFSWLPFHAGEHSAPFDYVNALDLLSEQFSIIFIVHVTTAELRRAMIINIETAAPLLLGGFLAGKRN
jgi:hypothetical protein